MKRYTIAVNGAIVANGSPMTKRDIVRKLNECEKALDRINRAENCLVCVGIGDAYEVAENTLKILREG